MPQKSTARTSRKVAPGVVERHAVGCPYVLGRRRCACSPSYRAEVQFTRQGQAKRTTRTFGSLKEAQEWRAAAKADIRRHGEIAPTPARVAAPALREAAADFLARAESGSALNRARRRYSQATVDSYETTLRRHVLPHIDPRTAVALGDLGVDTIDARTIQAMVDAVTVNASSSVARVADAALSAIVADLYGRAIIDSLPTRRILPPPPSARSERLSLAEVDRLIAAAKEYDEAKGRSLIEPLLALLAGGGLRIKEALAAVWGPNGLDLDADHPHITIPRDSTKTDAGVRVVGLDRTAAAILRRHRLATGRPADGVLVFAREDGQPLDRGGRVRAGMRAVADGAGVPRGFHLLRHTHGSLLADAGQGGHQIAARLGHRDAGFTARTYVHAADEISAAPAALDALRAREARRLTP